MRGETYGHCHQSQGLWIISQARAEADKAERVRAEVQLAAATREQNRLHIEGIRLKVETLVHVSPTFPIACHKSALFCFDEIRL
jgi:hypothetical protein